MSETFHLHPGGEPFPGFVLHLPVGRGSCGEVWEARGPDGAPVALKFLKCKNSLLAAKEVRSFQSLSGMYHPHLLRVFEVFIQADYLVIAMELAEGSLMDLFDAYAAEYGTAVQPEQVCHYLSQAAVALDYLNDFRHYHEGRRVAFQHCDIKPNNILIFGDKVKVADFGLVSPMTMALEAHDRAGTLDFAAPEVYRGRLSDRTDQYALAVTYCLLRGGRLPFHNTLGRFTPSYNRGQPDLSMLSSLERPIIAQALSVSPINRWSSCGEMMSRLMDLFHGVPAVSESVALGERCRFRLGLPDERDRRAIPR
ncbi:MAG TPA: protein kinase [Gemmataceae bacterium]|nr:protein kinase [Gemmataceae bacterium]